MRYLFKRDYIFYFQIVSVCIYTMSFFYITQLSMCSSDKRASTHSWRVLGFKPSHAFFFWQFSRLGACGARHWDWACDDRSTMKKLMFIVVVI